MGTAKTRQDKPTRKRGKINEGHTGVVLLRLHYVGTVQNEQPARGKKGWLSWLWFLSVHPVHVRNFLFLVCALFCPRTPAQWEAHPTTTPASVPARPTLARRAVQYGSIITTCIPDDPSQMYGERGKVRLSDGIGTVSPRRVYYSPNYPLGLHVSWDEAIETVGGGWRQTRHRSAGHGGKREIECVHER